MNQNTIALATQHKDYLTDIQDFISVGIMTGGSGGYEPKDILTHTQNSWMHNFQLISKDQKNWGLSAPCITAVASGCHII